MSVPAIITDNPAAFTGLLRAALIAAVAFGVQVSQVQQDALLNLATAVIIVVSLAVSVVTVKTTVPKTPSVDAPPAAIQQPKPEPIVAGQP